MVDVGPKKKMIKHVGAIVAAATLRATFAAGAEVSITYAQGLMISFLHM